MGVLVVEQRASRVDDGDEVWFVLEGLPEDPELVAALDQMRFVRAHGGWGRRFPQCSEFVDDAYRGFGRLVPPMLEAVLARTIPDWEEALEELCRRAVDAEISFFLVGSAGLAVQGVEVIPGDIDLVVSEDDARRLAAATLDVLVEPLAPTSGWVGRWWGRACICDFRVEWIGGVEPWVDNTSPPDFGLVALERSAEIDWRGWPLRVPPLDLARVVNERRGRLDRVHAIDKFFRQGG